MTTSSWVDFSPPSLADEDLDEVSEGSFYHDEADEGKRVGEDVVRKGAPQLKKKMKRTGEMTKGQRFRHAKGICQRDDVTG